MLVLSRKVGEKVFVPQLGLEFIILEVQGKLVRVGISAPEEVAVFREELWLKMQDAKRAENGDTNGKSKSARVPSSSARFELVD